MQGAESCWIVLSRNSERIPRSLLERIRLRHRLPTSLCELRRDKTTQQGGNPAAGAAGLASESKIRQNSLRRKIPCSLLEQIRLRQRLPTSLCELRRDKTTQQGGNPACGAAGSSIVAAICTLCAPCIENSHFHNFQGGSNKASLILF